MWRQKVWYKSVDMWFWGWKCGCEVRKCLWSEEVCLWSDEVYLWSGEVYLWSEEVCLWSDEVCLWSDEVYLWSEEVCLWSVEVCLWSDEVCVIKCRSKVGRMWLKLNFFLQFLSYNCYVSLLLTWWCFLSSPLGQETGPLESLVDFSLVLSGPGLIAFEPEHVSCLLVHMRCWSRLDSFVDQGWIHFLLIMKLVISQHNYGN